MIKRTLIKNDIERIVTNGKGYKLGYSWEPEQSRHQSDLDEANLQDTLAGVLLVLHEMDTNPTGILPSSIVRIGYQMEQVSVSEEQVLGLTGLRNINSYVEFMGVYEQTEEANPTPDHYGPSYRDLKLALPPNLK